MKEHSKSSDPAVETVVRSDGLRYQSKPAGSMFINVLSGGGGTMSCFFCGTHRPPSMRVMQKILGRNEPVCNPLCAKNPKSRKGNQSE
jgi:hypothetical protein